ncbi:hypothetical protein SAMN05444354_12063 [Stigmatella aurantiaca]|uniref:Uncharacterized protein n=1 Tax=Stigmatella aurantiaca TaxID=41 RepID=A0A1H8A4P6_STIAU|nr:hypothetical protein SAMN05444354_12063 [Stigmatella aurantiaca]
MNFSYLEHDIDPNYIAMFFVIAAYLSLLTVFVVPF